MQTLARMSGDGQVGDLLGQCVGDERATRHPLEMYLTYSISYMWPQIVMNI